jgi:hypothetical protein
MTDYWAKRGKKIVGPFPTIEQALAAFRSTYPHKGPDYARALAKNAILTGYGKFGPSSNMQWHNA